MADSDDDGKKQNNLRSLSVPEDPEGGSAYQYVNCAIWFATYVKNRAARGGITEEQIIAQFEMNVRKLMDPNWEPN